MAVFLSLFAGAGAQFLDNSGNVLTGGKVYSYAAGTTTPLATYTSSAGNISHSNPIILNAAGRVPTGEIWLTENTLYKFVLMTSNDVLIATYDDISSNNASFITNLANTSDPTKGDALVGFRQSNSSGNLAGSVGRTVHQKLQESISVMDFGAVGDGITDDTAAIQNAIDSLGVTGGTIRIPAGTYKCTATINLAKFVYLKGAGIRATTLQWNTTGAGIKMTSTINTSTPVNTGVYDMDLQNSNPLNTDGGYVDVCGTYVYLERVRIVGFKYGIIFDQTELGDIYLCELQQQITAGVWLVNGSEYTPGANIDFTNRISIKSCQFNQPATGYCIIDDGGYAHTFDANNFNGGLTHIRNAGQLNINISNSEFESAASTSMVWTNLTFNNSNAVGQSVGINLQNNLVIPTAGNYCVDMVNGSPLVALTNYFGNSSVAKINGLSNVFQFVDIGNTSGGGTYTSGTPSVNFALSSGTFTPAISFSTPGNLAVTYSTQIGQYQKFGNAVTFNIVLATSAFTWTTSAGNLKITGLPFAANSTVNNNQTMSFRFQGITKAGYTQFTPATDYAQTFLNVSASASGASTAGVVAADVPSGGSVYLNITGTYLI